MEQVNEAQPQSQPPSQRFYALEQLGELAGTITLISEGLQAYRAQVAGLLAGQKKAEAFELYRLLERQRTYLVEQIRATRPFLMELENPLAPAAQKLAEQLAAFPLMTADYSKLTEVLKRFADALPDHQTTDASIIGRLMNNVRLGHYCDEFVMRLSDGYQTVLGENGSTLSGGERQRISIARALLKDAPIILLDEATASLDPENEVLIQRAIARLVEGKTVIMIAHRLRTVVDADQIFVLENGKLVERGTHDELIAHKGLYEKLYHIQQESLDWVV